MSEAGLPTPSLAAPVVRALENPAARPYWRARLRLYALLAPTLIKIMWLHCRYPQDRQFARLGTRPRSWASPLPETWPLWMASKVRRFVARIPLIRRRACYWRSQILFHLLPRFGFPAKLHLGAATGGAQESPATHLWVTSRDRLLVDTPASIADYTELAAYPSHTPYD